MIKLIKLIILKNRFKKKNSLYFKIKKEKDRNKLKIYFY